MDNNKRLKLFNRFLKENNLLKLYYHNLENDMDKDFNHNTIDKVYDKINKMIKNGIYVDDYINEIHQAFFWNGTKQGFEFWKKIEVKWKQILYNS